mmetsp:Transcript_60919/g.125518  ORF Transcript_60919/g.125518 Transcript_60919/m.125518 type:complete len:103 (+) Transcript_60919:1889-2197(+)
MITRHVTGGGPVERESGQGRKRSEQGHQCPVGDQPTGRIRVPAVPEALRQQREHGGVELVGEQQGGPVVEQERERQHEQREGVQVERWAEQHERDGAKERRE